jgi:CheY-like chemotaxis protein
LTILYVADNEDNIYVVRRWLGRVGFTMLGARPETVMSAAGRRDRVPS